MKILITGGAGFVGPHLIEYIHNLKQGHTIATVVRPQSQDTKRDVWGADTYLGDLTNYATVQKLLQAVQPDTIFHLAAHSFVGDSFSDPYSFLSNNIMSTLNIFEAIRALEIDPVVLVAGSSEEYGLVLKKEIPIVEKTPLRPLSPYAVSKVGQEMLSLQYFRSYGIKNVLSRAFNHEGAGRGKQFFISNMCYQVALMEAGKQEPILHVGNLDAYRDITHVKDMVHAYWLATTADNIEYGTPYNIGSEKMMQMVEILGIIFDKTVMSIKLVQDEDRMRPSDVPILRADTHKFREATGWKPKLNIEHIIDDLLEYWRLHI